MCEFTMILGIYLTDKYSSPYTGLLWNLKAPNTQTYISNLIIEGLQYARHYCSGFTYIILGSKDHLPHPHFTNVATEAQIGQLAKDYKTSKCRDWVWISHNVGSRLWVLIQSFPPLRFTQIIWQSGSEGLGWDPRSISHKLPGVGWYS